MSKSTKILLAGSTGIPGRSILQSLRGLRSLYSSRSFEITVLKRQASAESQDQSSSHNDDYRTVGLDPSSFFDVSALTALLIELRPHIVISALNAEPRPDLDDKLVSAIVALNESSPSTDRPFYINGFTLDLLHPTVGELPAAMLDSLAPKINFATRLAQLANKSQIEYCTIVNAAFLDYTLIKGYLGINIGNRTAVMTEGGTQKLTGCTLKFVGDVVAQVVLFITSESADEQDLVRNRRLRVAETEYSGRGLLAACEAASSTSFEISERSIEDLKSSPISYINWSGKGASTFTPEGLEFGNHSYLSGRRRSLEDIVGDAMIEAFPDDEKLRTRVQSLKRSQS